MIAFLDNLISLLDIIGLSMSVLLAILFTLTVYGLYRLIVKVISLCKRFRQQSERAFLCCSIVCAFLVAILASLLSNTIITLLNHFSESIKFMMFLLSSHIELPTSVRGYFVRRFFILRRFKTELVGREKKKTDSEKVKPAREKVSLKCGRTPACAFVMRN